MEQTYKIRIVGVAEPVEVSENEYEFVLNMMRNRRGNHLFTIAGYTVMIGDNLTLINFDEDY